MKNTKNIWFLIVGIASLLVSCEDKQASTPFVYQDNMVYADITAPMVGDGSTFHSFQPNKVSFSGDTLSIYATYGNDNPGSSNASLGLYVYANKPGTYYFNNHNEAFFAAWGSNSMNTFAYYTDSAHTGYITITLLDTVMHKVSATFSFNTEMQQPMRNGESGSVTNGRFTHVQW